ncbi:hypothetical protein DERF_006006 [Dermatophagoides farinae]|uniref:Uncharacterized protein n=1 Tax=Dermatophagoides farinae TaxID=6954 RepID=A0A922I6L5_DERFA|nr:hypothetical protein DERF_006006 [Dermatophagoides farinae]
MSMNRLIQLMVESRSLGYGTEWHDVLVRNVALANQKYNLISIGQLERIHEEIYQCHRQWKMKIMKDGKCLLFRYRSEEINILSSMPIHYSKVRHL